MEVVCSLSQWLMASCSLQFFFFVNLSLTGVSFCGDLHSIGHGEALCSPSMDKFICYFLQLRFPPLVHSEMLTSLCVCDIGPGRSRMTLSTSRSQKQNLVTLHVCQGGKLPSSSTELVILDGSWPPEGSPALASSHAEAWLTLCLPHY